MAVAVLPRARQSMVGREAELAELQGLLPKSGLLTLTGPGGVGKTRLALAVAELVADRCADGVCLVELAPLADAQLVPHAVAAALGLGEQSDRPLLSALAESLAAVEMLLVVDNCEHLVGACAELLEHLLNSSSRLSVLATSRESLGVLGERTWQVPPLNEHDRQRLFLERAIAARRDFALTDDNSAAVAEVCRRLDGLPLAIELAAARVKVLGVDDILARLDRLLDASPPAARQRTLRATIDWSFELLTSTEQAALARLSVFAGGWSIAAAEAVCDASLDVLGRLADKSLVIVEEQHAQARHRLLETVRQYAAERLTERGERHDVAQRHALFFLELAERSGPQLLESTSIQAISALARDQDNLRTALDWLQRHEPPLAARLAGSLWWFWFRQGLWHEGRRWLERALESGDDASRAHVLLGLGVLGWAQGNHVQARGYLDSSIALLNSAPVSADLGMALQFLSMEVLGMGEVADARRLVDDAVRVLRDAAAPLGLAIALASQGVVALAEGDDVAAHQPLEESIALLGAIGDPWAVALPTRNLGIVALLEGRLDRAAALLRNSLSTLHDVRDPWFVSRSVETLAVVVAAQHDFSRAARLFGAGEALRGTVGAAVLPFYRLDYDRALGETRAALGEQAFTAAWAEGRAMRIEQALAFALEPVRQPAVNLSPREREVLGLLARGLSNREIASALVITEKTAEAHVGSILRKLDLTSRAQAAIWAVEHQGRN